MIMDSATINELPGQQHAIVSLGHCVILNDIEQPCARMIGVVVGIEGEFIRTRYLCADADMTPYNKRGCVNRREVVTAIEDFGVELRSEGNSYWCEKVGDSVARYPDGLRRTWQEHSGPIRHRFRADVMGAICRG